jgi:mRNA interferase MazF
MKNFDGWNSLKKDINTVSTIKYYKTRQIWWIRLGCNVGHEQDGKGDYFERPILIIKKFNNRIFLGIPLTTKIKNNPFYFKITDNENILRCGIISQLRLLDASRLRQKIGFVNQNIFEEIRKAIREII